MNDPQDSYTPDAAEDEDSDYEARERSDYGPSEFRHRAEPEAERGFYERQAFEEPEQDPLNEEPDGPEGVVLGVDVDEIARQSLEDDGAVGEVGFDEDAAREPQVWFLSKPLLDLYNLWQTRVAGSWDDLWCLHWRKHSELADAVDVEFQDAVFSWFEAVRAIDVNALKTPDGESLRRRVYDLSQQVRTYVLLCPAVTSAVSIANYVRGKEGDGFNHYRELLVDPTYKLFQPIRTYVYQSTPEYKVKKRKYDHERNKDPKVKEERAARRRVQTARELEDPAFKAREAERKRVSRQKRSIIARTIKDV